MISLFIPCLPVAMPRQRHRVVTVPGRGAFATNYTPTKHPVHTFKASIMQAVSAVYHEPPVDGPLSLSMTAIFPRPKSMTFKKRPMPREPHTSRPDAENVAKAVLDCLTGTVWINDSQICELVVRKFVAAGDSHDPIGVHLDVEPFVIRADCASANGQEGEE